MNIYAAALVIFLTALVVMLLAAYRLGEADRIPLERLADPAPLPGEQLSYGPFPADTGPLLILSEKAAANAALEREIRLRCAEAEAKIPPRWR